MSFAFNFESDEVVGGVASRLDAEPPPAHVLPIPWHAIATSGFASALYTFPTAAPILTINQTQAEMLLSQHGGAVAQASAMSSDLVPQMYEGGMKVWECCSDLIEFLQTSQLLRPHHTVLEVGCGAGLPGVFAARLGCTVHFQDFNDEVLVQVTAPTLFLNGFRQRLVLLLSSTRSCHSARSERDGYFGPLAIHLRRLARGSALVGEPKLLIQRHSSL
eukprot:m.65298 g.65298  ORF g.65298 m.65298 type:complete len:218 (+) comp49785_c0_seq4:1-654(+)